MEDTAQREIDLRKKVGESLGVSPKELNPDDQSILKGIKDKLGDAVHVTETTFGETIGTEVKYPRGNKAIEWIKEKFRREKKQAQPLDKAA